MRSPREAGTKRNVAEVDGEVSREAREKWAEEAPFYKEAHKELKVW